MKGVPRVGLNRRYGGSLAPSYTGAAGGRATCTLILGTKIEILLTLGERKKHGGWGCVRERERKGGDRILKNFKIKHIPQESIYTQNQISCSNYSRRTTC